MDSEIEIVNALDPRCLELEATGYILVGRSWGAHLFLNDLFDLSLYEGKVSRLESAGYRVQSLEHGLAEVVLELEITNNSDYPYTPATAHAMPTLESTRKLWSADNRVFGAFKDGVLIGVVAASKGAKEIQIDFGSMRSTPWLGSWICSSLSCDKYVRTSRRASFFNWRRGSQ